MDISQADWIAYKDKLSAISDTAAEKFEKWLTWKGGYQNVSKKEMINMAYALSTKYGEAAASLAAQMYDETAALSGVTVPAAEVANTASYGEIAKAINGVTKTLTTDKNISNVVARHTKMAGADTTLKNAARDGAEFAWIPAGDTCIFCLELASNGWRHISAKSMKNGHAEHIHANCDCTYSVRFDGKSNVKGYNPEKYKEMFKNAEGDTPQEKVNSLRRIQYNKDPEKYSAQKRIAYEERNRKLNYGKTQQFIRGTQTISASPVNKYSENNIFVADNLKLTNREVRYVNKRVSEAKKILGISKNCNIPVIIVKDDLNLASYNPRTNILYVSSKMTNAQKVVELQQGYAMANNQNSTMVHELIHWKDAEDYRKNIGLIESAEPNSKYSIYQRNKAIETLEKANVDLSNPDKILEISKYSYKRYLDNDFEEVYTEWRTKELLKGF